MGAKRVAGLEAVGAHQLSATGVALPTARTLTDINTGELVTAKVKNAVYNKEQEKELSSYRSRNQAAVTSPSQTIKSNGDMPLPQHSDTKATTAMK
jgi:hypothetical protein